MPRAESWDNPKCRHRLEKRSHERGENQKSVKSQDEERKILRRRLVICMEYCCEVEREQDGDNVTELGKAGKKAQWE